MEGIKIEVTGNIARVIEKPSRITSGTIGLPIEFIFDSQWDGLGKMAVFRAGKITKTIPNPEGLTTVPWELLKRPNVWLSIGVYGVNSEGTVAIPTVWANVCVINVGVRPDSDHTIVPTPPGWEMLDAVTYTKQIRSPEQQKQARENIGLEEGILEFLIAICIAPVLLDGDGAILADNDNAILITM